VSLLVALGPILLPTLKGDLVETVGEQLETVGAGVVPGERRPRPLPLTIPVHADVVAANRFETGARMRRQVRALMENSPARLQGLYLAFAPDPEQNGWLLIGGGDLKYAEGGISFSNYELSLTDVYRVANMRTHRSARRLFRLDRRLATVARDYHGTLFSTNFSAVTALTIHYLGVGVTDVRVGTTSGPPTLATRSTKDGPLSYVEALTDAEVVDYEHAEDDLYKAIVRIYDDHGAPGTESLWGPVYGPDQPLTGTPVMDNAICRAIPNLATGRIDVQSWSGTAWVLNETVEHPAGAAGFAARVLEWTTERGVIRITSALTGNARGELYITLQRGWTGPRFELYVRNAGGTGTASLNVYVASIGEATWQRSNAGPTGITATASIGTFAAISPWVALVGPGADLGVALAVVQEAVNLRGAILSGREGLAFESSTPYVSVGTAVGPRASAAFDADTFGRQHMIDAQQIPELVARA
jgi:hypothetical protein